MNTQPAFGFKDLFASLVGDMVKAVSERGGENKERQFARSQAAAHTIMGFQPRDSTEAMIAGHCLMFHEMMVDSVRETLRGEIEAVRRVTRKSILAMDKAFAGNLALLERYRARPSQGRRDEPAAVADPIVQPVARTEPPAEIREAADSTKQADPAMTQQAAAEPALELPLPDDITLNFNPSRESIAACLANPEAMAALNAGDPKGFARALGVDAPSEAYLAAAGGPDSVFARRTPGAKSPRLSGGAPGAEMATPSRYPNGAGAADGRRDRLTPEATDGPNGARDGQVDAAPPSTVPR